MTSSEQKIDKVALTVAEFCHAYGVGKSLAYEEIHSGRLGAKKAGRRTLIPVRDAEAWFQSLPAGGAK